MSPPGIGYPQQGAAPPPQAGPAAQAGPAQPAAPGGPEGPPERGTELAQMLGGLNESLTMLADALGRVGVPPEAKQLAGSIVQSFQQLMQVLSGGNAQQPSAQPAAAPPGAATPEAGAADVRPAQ